MPPHPTAVLIVGAGPTGLTLACELARRQVPFRLADAAPAPFNGSRGKGTQPRSLEVFDDLGIAGEVVAAGRFHLPIRMYGEAGGHQDIDLHAGRHARPDAPYGSTLLIPQWRVEQALRERMRGLGGHVEYGVSLATFTQDAAGVAATLVHADGRREVQRAAYLVGCDGGRSIVRKLAGIAFHGETLEQHRMLVGDVSADGLDREHWHVWRGAGGFLALAPLPGTGQCQFQAAVGPGLDEEPSLALCQRLLEERSGRRDIRLSDPTWLSLWRANVRMVDRYRAGRVFLAGDAAHVHSPAGGQGMNTGIQDAYNLGWKLAAVLRGADGTLLDTYEEERLPVAEWLLGLSSRLHFQAVEEGHFATRRDEETLQLAINYRHASLARELRARPGKLAAGDRAPDAPGLRDVHGEHRLFDLFRGPHVTLLAFGDGWDDALDALAAPYGNAVRQATVAPGKFDDALGHAHAAYDVDRGLFVIRPDGYVGLATDARETAPVAAYLARLLGRG